MNGLVNQDVKAVASAKAQALAEVQKIKAVEQKVATYVKKEVRKQIRSQTSFLF